MNPSSNNWLDWACVAPPRHWRLPLNDEHIDALATLLEAECLHRDSLAQARRLKLAHLSQRAHPADVDLRASRGLGKSRWAQLLSLNWFK